MSRYNAQFNGVVASVNDTHTSTRYATVNELNEAMTEVREEIKTEIQLAIDGAINEVYYGSSKPSKK